MVNERFRLVHLGDHTQVAIADDETNEYIHGLPVDMLNSYDGQVKAMKNKLEELGFILLFRYEDYDMASKKFNDKFSLDPQKNVKGEWLVFTQKEYEKIKRGE